MKRYIFIIIAIFQFLISFAQTKGLVVSAGGNNSNGVSSISWTLGQTISSTFSSPGKSLILTQLFQDKPIVTLVEEEHSTPVNVHLYPNPTNDIINIHIGEKIDGPLVLTLLDGHGKPVRSGVLESSNVDKQLNLRDIPSGMYFLRVTKGSNVAVYKVVKL